MSIRQEVNSQTRVMMYLDGLSRILKAASFVLAGCAVTDTLVAVIIDTDI